jgi:2-amino-4-hydroxy-6-hydroxymethyldihydropteridine diphosphokinase
MKIVRTTYLSLGSNMGGKLENLQKAVDRISELIGQIKKVSSVYQSPSWGYLGEDFLNICIEVSTHLTPEMLLQKVLEIEKEMGRQRKEGSGYQDRTIDIDILLFDDEIMFYNDLKVPHPEMLKRRFVLVPLTEIGFTPMPLSGRIWRPVISLTRAMMASATLEPRSKSWPA